MFKPRFSTTIIAAGAMALAALLPSGAAGAAELTPWNNAYVGDASVRGAGYSIKFIGTGKHVYENVKTNGCSYKMARREQVTIYKASQPSKIIYRAVIDGAHTIYATEPFNYGTVRYRSERALVAAVKSRVEASAAIVAWRTGGKELVQFRSNSLASDLGEAISKVANHTVAEAKKMAKLAPAESDGSRPYYEDYIGEVQLGGYNLGADLKSTKALYGSGCGEGAGSAQFERRISVSGTGKDYTVLDTNLTDDLTLGFEAATHRAFRLVDGQRVYCKDTYAAVRNFWKERVPADA